MTKIERKAVFSPDWKTLTVYDEHGSEFIVQPLTGYIYHGLTWAAWNRTATGLSSVGYGYNVPDAIEDHKRRAVMIEMGG